MSLESSNGGPIPLVMCLDVEPDEQQVPRGRKNPWTGFEAALEWIKPVRDAAQKLTGAPANFGWFLRMDSQIELGYGSRRWVADAHGSALAALRDAGDELGVHPHAWRWDDARGWFVDLADQEWIAQVTADSFEAYSISLGRACRAHRFGDGFMSEALIDQLRGLGVRIDLTAEPGMTKGGAVYRGPAFRGSVPFSAGASRIPALRGTARDGLVLVPLTAVDPDVVLPPWRRLGRRIRYAGQLRHRQMVLALPWPARTFWDLIARDVDAGELQVLAFGIRSSAFTDASETEWIADKLRGLAEHPLGARVAFMTPSASADYVAGRAF